MSKVKIQKLQEEKSRRIMLSSKWAVCDSKKSKFIRKQDSSGLLSSLGIKAPLSKTSLVGPLLL